MAGQGHQHYIKGCRPIDCQRQQDTARTTPATVATMQQATIIYQIGLHSGYMATGRSPNAKKDYKPKRVTL